MQDLRQQRQEKVLISYDGRSLEVPVGTSLFNLYTQYGKGPSHPVMGARYNNEVVDLYTEVTESGEVNFLDLQTEDGRRIYRQSLVFLLSMSVNELFPQRELIVQHSLGQSYYCEFRNMKEVPSLDLVALEAKMRERVTEDDPILPQVFSRENALRVLSAFSYEDKVALLDNLGLDKVRLYSCGSYSNYSYYILAPSTGYLKVFHLQPYDKGFLLRFPDEENTTKIASYPNIPKLSQVFRESEKWADILGISNLAGLINVLKKDPEEGKYLIHTAEALQEKKIALIADEIYAKRDQIRLILIAGPSSSGKTTFAQRLAIQLRVCGMKPVSISTDDYFVNRSMTPRDEKGEYDFEALETVDLELFNNHLAQLIEGQKVEIPVFNFHLGQREWQQRYITVSHNNPIIIEGIHSLNEKLTAGVKRENKYKIYISALTQISIDNHNRIPTTDARLIRRIVRDNRCRSQDALATLKRWPSVRKGEERNIFPYQEEADMMFNSALIYELCIFKKYVYPLLEKVTPDVKEYSDAERLLNLLSYFPDLSREDIPLNSILREFIGGSSIHHG